MQCLILMLHPPVARSVGPPEIASCLLPPRSAAQPELPPKHNHHIHLLHSIEQPSTADAPSKTASSLIEQPRASGAPPSETAPTLSPSLNRAAPRSGSSPEVQNQPLPLSLHRAAPRSGSGPLQKHSYLPLSIDQADGHD